LPARLSDSSLKPGKFSFNMKTWSQGGLRYFVIGDADAANIDSLARFLRPLYRLTTVMSEGLT
jgi:hypothetical protein